MVTLAKLRGKHVFIKQYRLALISLLISRRKNGRFDVAGYSARHNSSNKKRWGSSRVRSPSVKFFLTVNNSDKNTPIREYISSLGKTLNTREMSL